MKPCPYCGSKNYQHEGSDAGELWFSCQGCGAFGPVSTNTEGDDYSEAQEKWNTRPIEDALRAENRRLREKLGIIRLQTIYQWDKLDPKWLMEELDK